MSKIVVKKTITLPLFSIALIATAVLWILKITGTITVSWWVVLSPLIAVFAVSAMFLIIFVIIMLGFLLLTAASKKR